MKSLAALPLAWIAVSVTFVSLALSAVQPRTDEYALILDDAPLVKDGGRLSVRSLTLGNKQAALTQELIRRKIRVSGSVKLLLNAVFVQTPRGSRPDLTNLPNVKRAVWLPPLKKHLNTALGLVQVPGAWNNSRIGGQGNAGAGVKIGIIDTGLDDLNPALNDPNLTIPAGYPLVSDPSFSGVYTNNKVIVSRSYVGYLSAADDTTPYDYVGHGTAVAMIAAGGTIQGPAATITGVAPKAYLGNYKIFGTPGVNDYASNLAFLLALEDAVADGMDIVTASFGNELTVGNAAIFGPIDNIARCPASIRPNIPDGTCDVIAYAVENAVENLGLTVVVSAGDDGQIGNVYPTLGTITSPGDAPGAITVGATTNSHTFVSRLTASGSGATAGLGSIDALFGDTTKPTGAFSAPIIDVTKSGDDGTACNALAANSLTGSIALVARGLCNFDVKANNVAAAGGIAIVLYLDSANDGIFVPTFLADSFIPTVLINNASGTALKSAADSANITVTLDPSLYEEAAEADDVAGFSSRGPAIGLFSSSPTTIYAVKPDLVAVGQDIYTATQFTDPQGNLYDPSAFTSVAGTSFAVPLVAGAAALVKQANPSFTAAQLKSAVVNTATTNVYDNGVLARVNAMGAGKLNAADAVNVAVTCEPANVHFGVLNGTTPPFEFHSDFKLTNVTAGTVSLSLSVSQDADNFIAPSVTPSSLTIAPGQSATVRLAITGNEPNAGTYDGQMNIVGAGPALHVPYQYIEASGTPTYIFPVLGDSKLGVPSSGPYSLLFRLLDDSGVPVAATPSWKVAFGDGSISQTPIPPETSTDQYGIGGAYVNLGSQLGTDVFEADAGGLSWQFFLTAQNAPVVESTSNAATFGPVIAPGSYIALFGSDLATTTAPYLKTGYLPISLATTTVSFTTSTFSVPGRLSYVGPSQVNVQVPWELVGQTSAVMQVSVNGVFSAPQTVNLTAYSPGVFEYPDPGTGQLIAAALDFNYKIINAAAPIARGQGVSIYANGLGPVTPAQSSGYPALADPRINTNAAPTVTIGNQPAPVSFHGLSPGSVSLYQLNLTVPSNISAGYQPLVITVNGAASQVSHIYVR